MDLASVLGLLVGVSAILLGNALEGGHITALVQPTAFLIVVGGTLGATMLGAPLPVFLRAVKALRGVFMHEPRDMRKLVDEIVSYAQKARRDGIISLEGSVRETSEPFLRKALMMAIDGADSKTMRESLELAIAQIEEEGERLAKVWESAGGYAPTIGIIGAVMGLIHVMQNLADVSAVGAGIAVAFVATIYGVALANLVFLPASTKMKTKLEMEITTLEMILEGALAIQEGQSHHYVRDKLSAYVPEGAGKAAAHGGAPADLRVS
jgi:chemotaxis protein MotA